MSEQLPERYSPLRPVYTGPARYLLCSDVSLQDCNRVLSEHSDHCGNPEHVRVVSAERAKGEPDYKTRTNAQRRTVIVDEDYEIVGFEPGEPVTLDPHTFDVSGLWVATKVQREFTAYHGVDVDEAIRNVRLVVKRAIEKRGYRQRGDGWHHFSWSGYQVTVTPDLTVALRYTTTHFERTPRQFAEGVKSRLSRRSRSTVSRGPVPDGLRSGDVVEGRVSRVVKYGAFVEVVAGIFGLLHVNKLEDSRNDARLIVGEGDRVTVRIAEVDRDRQRIALELVSKRQVDSGAV